MDWVERVAGIRRWTRQGERAPHKPLLLLYALGRFQREGGRPISFSSAEADLKALLREFGPPRDTSPGYPFHHLTGDGLWLVDTVHGPGSPGSELGRLRAAQATGRLTPDRTIAVSRKFVGRSPAAERMVLALAGKPVRDPQTGLDPVDVDHIEWHSRQVFRTPARQG
ncbi:hypothetical protein IL992_41995 [Microbispora sp. NEAU-D428]|uniref:hypothetical protein n=1 Tax=Microbispora sitophila TaxID=2771537 RepID=UPI0018679F4F|nr:hypothetical protein [Microbispora sitophila]MBE3015692.1 hypothetical protein [Microbispora sitophila]